jgi:hypothetical protein
MLFDDFKISPFLSVNDAMILSYDATLGRM